MKTTTNSFARDIMPATFENVQKTLDIIRSWTGGKGYRVDAMPVDKKTLDEAVANLSKTQLKKLGRSLDRAACRTNMYNANMLMHSLHKLLGAKGKCPRVRYSEREEQIQDARKKWVAAREAASAALAEYKEVKADFYTKTK